MRDRTSSPVPSPDPSCCKTTDSDMTLYPSSDLDVTMALGGCTSHSDWYGPSHCLALDTRWQPRPQTSAHPSVVMDFIPDPSCCRTTDPDMALNYILDLDVRMVAQATQISMAPGSSIAQDSNMASGVGPVHGHLSVWPSVLTILLKHQMCFLTRFFPKY